MVHCWNTIRDSKEKRIKAINSQNNDPDEKNEQLTSNKQRDKACSVYESLTWQNMTEVAWIRSEIEQTLVKTANH